jgi:hypothetical protein
MSIEQKIAELLAESKKAQLAEQAQSDEVVAEEVFAEEEIKPAANTPNPDNAKNAVVDEKEAEGGTSKKANRVTQSAAAGDQSVIRQGNTVKEDIDALMNGEELSEEFRAKATTIFEAAVMNRVKDEVARLEEEFESKLAEQVEKNVEGIVEQVDGYLGYIAEQWIANNEIALERGMKSEILESFVTGMKGLFEEHYIDVPEERFDVLGEMEQKMADLETRLNEQVASNIELSKSLAEAKRTEIVKTVSEGLTDTETEKFMSLVEELSYEDQASFETKVKTIRENYFTTKGSTEIKSVVTDAPVEVLTEGVSKKLDPAMSAYAAQLNKLK